MRRQSSNEASLTVKAMSRASIMDRLTDRSLQTQQNQLANMTAANQSLAGLYDMGFGLAGKVQQE